jgi:fructokinase
MRNAMTPLSQPWEGRAVIAVCGEAIVDLLPTGPTSYAAIARLGVPVTMLARLSDDDFGQLLRAHLSTNGVDLSRAVAAAEPSGLAVVTRAADGTASYRFLLDGAADWQWTDAELGPLPQPVLAVHAGSIALATTPAVERLLERSRDTCTISIDPNLRPSTLEAVRQALPRWLQLADIVKASSDDIALLHPGQDPVQVAERWAEQGPALVVLTAGADGAYAVVAGEVVHEPARPVQVVDTVGAGDTFSAGLLVGLHRAGLLGSRLAGFTVDELRPALDLALRAAAVSCSRAGADPPRARELSGAGDVEASAADEQP